MKNRVLVIDDEAAIHRFLKPALDASGYDVLPATTGTEGLRLVATSAPDIVVLDLGLPDMDGKDVLRSLRAYSSVPVIVLSARDREAEKIAALDLGADDYVEKPFAIGELLARVRSSLRRVAREIGETTRWEVGSLLVDTVKRTVTRAGEPLRLTPKEYDLLRLLVTNAGRVVTHRQIMTTIWGPAHLHDTQYLRVLVGQLRAKIELEGASERLIQNEPGVGYRLADNA